MKGTGMVLIIMALAMVGAHAQPEKNIESKITDVTVFLTKAQITRTAHAKIEVGKSSLILSGLTSLLDPASIQVRGKGGFVILGINHRQNFLSEINTPKSIKILKDSLDFYQKQLALEQSQKEILSREEQMILNNQKVGGTSQNLTVAELKAMADFFRSRLGEIVTTRMKIDDKAKKINDRISRLHRQLREQNDLYSRNTSEIVVNVSSDGGAMADLEINYVVSNAGWNPEYDLRATNTKLPVQLSYKANVFQGTGEDWKNVKLKLSTANPNESGLKPELYTWYLDFHQPVAYLNYKSMDRKASAPAPATRGEELVVASDSMDTEEAETVADFVSTIQTTLNTEFDISIPYTIESSAKPTLVDIRNYEMKANYEYSVAPKLDADAFLLAKATGWEEFNLLPGEANIFFEGTFVGKTFVDPSSVKDTLTVSLGRDKRIVVKREKLKDLTSRKLIGTSQKESYTWEISVRNTKTEQVKIVIEDQLPVTQNTQIEVTPVDLGGARLVASTGKLVWVLSLQPNESRKVSFKYEVKYPKDKQVSGL